MPDFLNAVVDISHWDRDVDFQAVAGSGVLGIMRRPRKGSSTSIRLTPAIVSRRRKPGFCGAPIISHRRRGCPPGGAFSLSHRRLSQCIAGARFRTESNRPQHGPRTGAGFCHACIRADRTLSRPLWRLLSEKASSGPGPIRCLRNAGSGSRSTDQRRSTARKRS